MDFYTVIPSTSELDCSILVNKSHRLESSYIPPCLTEPNILFDAPSGDPRRLLSLPASRASERLFAAGREQGIFLYGISGYRSYDRQKVLYETRLNQKEKSYVDLYLAPPGASEHQTGLALDVSCPSVGLQLENCFASTTEGKWLASHAPLYGFIIRYPKNKELITGYGWEPWHIRYVGKSLALYLSLTGLTLEEYHEHQSSCD